MPESRVSGLAVMRVLSDCRGDLLPWQTPRSHANSNGRWGRLMPFVIAIKKKPSLQRNRAAPLSSLLFRAEGPAPRPRNFRLVPGGKLAVYTEGLYDVFRYCVRDSPHRTSEKRARAILRITEALIQRLAAPEAKTAAARTPMPEPAARKRSRQEREPVQPRRLGDPHAPSDAM